MKVIKATNTTKVVSARHFHVLVDVSGSMYSELDKLKPDLQNTLSSVSVGDMVSIIYYSSKGDCGFILKNYQHTGIDSLVTMQRAIQLLKARNLTGFVDPLVLCKNNLSANMDNVVVFMSDGYENQSSEKDVLQATKELGEMVVGGVVVEYGSYANHQLLTKMADHLGTFKYASDFKNFDIVMREVVSNSFSKKSLILSEKHDFAFSISKELGVVSYSYDENHKGYLVGEADTLYLYNQGDSLIGEGFDVIFAIMYLAQLRNNSKLVYDLLKFLSFVEVIDSYQAAIGKEKVNNFLNYILFFVKYPDQCLQFAQDPNYLPADDAYCLFDLLETLSTPGNKVYTRHPAFSYKRIGAKKVQASALLNDDDRAALSNCLSVEDAKALLDQKYELTFDYLTEDSGNALSLVYNSNRANISFAVTHNVRVDLTKIPNYTGQIKKFDTRIFRNYTIVKDMILNVKVLPFTLTNETYQELVGFGVLNNEGYAPDKVYLINLESVPMVNRNMLNSVDFNDYVKVNLDSTRFAFTQKVINSLFKEKFPEGRGKNFVDLYGEEFTLFLKEHGITEFNGFNPPVVALAGTDVYYAPSVDCKISSFGTVPTLKTVLEKKAKGGKLTPSETLMYSEYENVLSMLSSDTKEAYEELLANIRDAKRTVDLAIAKQVFAILLNRAIPETDEMDVTFEGFSVKAKIVFKEEEIDI